jgi:protoporphyrinogen oxidase
MRTNFLGKPAALVLLLAYLLIVLPSCGKEGPPPPPLEELGPGAYDVVVIGAGGGGISAAAKLAMGGMKVLVIEQHDKVGGYMTAFERDDYRFEVSLHAMDGMGRELFPKLGIEDKVKVVKLERAYRSVFPDFTFDCLGTSNSTERASRRNSPTRPGASTNSSMTSSSSTKPCGL